MLVYSNMLPLGTRAPDFLLPDTLSEPPGQLRDWAACRGSIATVVMFVCNHCPYVIHIQRGIMACVGDYQAQGVGFVAINVNDVTAYPQDHPDRMREVGHELGYDFPYLFDASQEVAKAYQAACTPDFYVFDADAHCVYRGRFDGSSPGSQVPVSGEDLRMALDALLSGQGPVADQKPSMGCHIKWLEPSS